MFNLKNKMSFGVLAVVVLLMLAILSGGGCSGSSSSSISNREQFVVAFSEVVDDIEDIANSAISDRTILTALDDILGQYIILSSDINRVKQTKEATKKAIGCTLISGDVVSAEISPISVGMLFFDRAAFVQLWSGNHITVNNGEVTSFIKGQSDYQLTITSSDNHVTKLTITPNSQTGYWQAFATSSALADALLDALSLPIGANAHGYLLFFYTYASANIEVTYNDTPLLKGTISVNYPGKTPVTSPTNIAENSRVYMNNPHNTKLDLTVYPQDKKDYAVGINFDSTTTSTGDNSIKTNTSMKMNRTNESNSGTMLDLKTVLDVTASDSDTSLLPSKTIQDGLELNIADKIRIAEISSLDLTSIRLLYNTGTSASDETLRNNAAKINTLLSDAGLSLYLYRNTAKAGDIRALVDKMGSYNHVRLGIQFVDENQPDVVKNIVNKEDLEALKSIVHLVTPNVRAFAEILTGTGYLSEITSNEIVVLIFNDLFGTN